jgi:hypothetical protein
MRQATANFSKSTSNNPLVVLALLAYVLTGAVVPQGYMAAPLDSGTAFHLCPGDFGSSLIIDTRPVEPGAHQHHHHGGHGDHGSVKGEKSSAEPGCTFSGYSSAEFTIAGETPAAIEQQDAWFILQGRQLPPPPAWLHRPARSPPA